MTQREILQCLQQIGALLRGHFRLSSGLHSEQYLQCALVLQDPRLAERLCRVLAQSFRRDRVTVVAGPAIGGIVMAFEMARLLRARAIFGEREEDRMTLRRGFTVSTTDRVLLVEDVITTGGSVKELKELIERQGARVVGIGSLVDRSTTPIRFGVTWKTLLRLPIETFRPEACPLCKAKTPLIKPGSRQV